MSRETGWYRTIKNGLDKSNPINWEIIYYYGNIKKWETGDICELDDDFTATRYVDKTPVNPIPADEVFQHTDVQRRKGRFWDDVCHARDMDTAFDKLKSLVLIEPSRDFRIMTTTVEGRVIKEKVEK